MSKVMDTLEQQGGICRECQVVRGYRPILDSVNLCARHAAMPEWQVVETAPKDAFLLLLYNEQEGVCAGYWDICEKPPTWVQVETQGITSGYMEPTHWMPLPNPPKVED